MKAVSLSFVYFFFLLGSYYILRPVRDAMGTVYGVDDLEVLWTYTFIFSFIAAPVFGYFASRLKLSTLLPWTYGFFVINILIFYVLFEQLPENRTLAGVFYCWTSVFNMFIVSVFWSFMADMFSRQQAKRIFGFVAAGGSIGCGGGPGAHGGAGELREQQHAAADLGVRICDCDRRGHPARAREGGNGCKRRARRAMTFSPLSWTKKSAAIRSAASA